MANIETRRCKVIARAVLITACRTCFGKRNYENRLRDSKCSEKKMIITTLITTHERCTLRFQSTMNGKAIKILIYTHWF